MGRRNRVGNAHWKSIGSLEGGMAGDARDETRYLYDRPHSFLVLHQGSSTFLAFNTCICIPGIFYNPPLSMTCFVIAVHEYSVCILVVLHVPASLGLFWGRSGSLRIVGF